MLRYCIRHYFFLSASFISTASTVMYTLSLHDALPISEGRNNALSYVCYLWGCKEQTVTLDGEESNPRWDKDARFESLEDALNGRSEEHTSELQSRFDLVCRLLLEKKNKKKQ